MAYLVTTQLMVNPARIADFEVAWQVLLDSEVPAKGFHYGATLNSLGQPAKFGTFYVWDDEARFQAYFHGPGRTNTVTASEGLFTRLRPHESWDEVLGIATDLAQFRDKAEFVTLAEWQLDPGVAIAQEFEASRKLLFSLDGGPHSGLVEQRLWRYAGSPSRYLVSQLLVTRPSSAPIQPSQDIVNFALQNPRSKFASQPPTVEFYRIAHSATP